MFRVFSGLYLFETQHVLYVDPSGERALFIAARIERIKKFVGEISKKWRFSRFPSNRICSNQNQYVLYVERGAERALSVASRIEKIGAFVGEISEKHQEKWLGSVQ